MSRSDLCAKVNYTSSMLSFFIIIISLHILHKLHNLHDFLKQIKNQELALCILKRNFCVNIESYLRNLSACIYENLDNIKGLIFKLCCMQHRGPSACPPHSRQPGPLCL